MLIEFGAFGWLLHDVRIVQSPFLAVSRGLCSCITGPFAILLVDKELAIVPATSLSHAEGAEIQPALPHPTATKVVPESWFGVFVVVLCVGPVSGRLCVLYMLFHPLNLL